MVMRRTNYWAFDPLSHALFPTVRIWEWKIDSFFFFLAWSNERNFFFISTDRTEKKFFFFANHLNIAIFIDNLYEPRLSTTMAQRVAGPSTSKLQDCRNRILVQLQIFCRRNSRSTWTLFPNLLLWCIYLSLLCWKIWNFEKWSIMIGKI